jgi:hypothetical protein
MLLGEGKRGGKVREGALFIVVFVGRETGGGEEMVRTGKEGRDVLERTQDRRREDE